MTRPSVRERIAERICPNCGKPSPERRSNRGPAPMYCDQACKRAMNNRNLADGLALVPYLKAWRADRGTGEIAKTSFYRICQIVDELNEADRKAGRPRADYYAAVLIDSNAQTVNDLRYGRRKVAEGLRRQAAELGATAPIEPTTPDHAPEPETDPQPDLATILQMIADGHNDPRTLAAEALGLR